uniref:beta-2-microglobulin-like n=1 Tax=Doryrhamphus excisus TaxID=161450 RepID=UPI0025AEC4A0|nr:beta-2-microglobulin-like [Doryrhamphus excisus]
MVVTNMRLLAISATVLAVCWMVDSKFSSPKVQVYSHKPARLGEENTVICHVSEFHPPDINIQLFKNGVEIREAVQTDLSFKKNWHFHLTKHIDIIPAEGDKYFCKVIHGMELGKDYDWEPNM